MEAFRHVELTESAEPVSSALFRPAGAFGAGAIQQSGRAQQAGFDGGTKTARFKRVLFLKARADRFVYREQDMMFRKSVIAVWLLVGCLSAHAQTAVDTTDPSIIHAPIVYPSSARSAGEEGTVLVEAEVDSSGRAVDARVDKSSGHPDLDAAALQSISRWSFRPATKSGNPVARWVAVPVNFQLTHETTDIFALSEATLLAASSVLLSSLGSLVWVIGFVWSIVLAKRKSILWLSGMVALWIVTYPLFVAMHWPSAKRNLMVVSLGIVLFCLGLYVASSRHLSI